MKKRIIILLCVCIAAAAVLVMRLSGSRTEVAVFDLDDFGYELQRFPSDEQIDVLIIPQSVTTPESAMKIAETVWFEVFSEDTVIGERPYRVSFDRKNGVWLVSGTLSEYEMGGVANILIRKSDSAILAVWHDR